MESAQGIIFPFLALFAVLGVAPLLLSLSGLIAELSRKFKLENDRAELELEAVRQKQAQNNETKD